MLVFTRKKNEKIVINDDITITVVDIRGDKVRLGIDAPKEVSVHRREVYEANQEKDKVVLQHGINCTKKLHEGSGYLHGEDDDSPYDDDGVEYCGRCHYAIDAGDKS